MLLIKILLNLKVEFISMQARGVIFEGAYNRMNIGR